MSRQFRCCWENGGAELEFHQRQVKYIVQAWQTVSEFVQPKTWLISALFFAWSLLDWCYLWSKNSKLKGNTKIACWYDGGMLVAGLHQQKMPSNPLILQFHCHNAFFHQKSLCLRAPLQRDKFKSHWLCNKVSTEQSFVNSILTAKSTLTEWNAALFLR